MKCPAVCLFFVLVTTQRCAAQEPATKPIIELKTRVELVGHTAPVTAIVYAPDGRSIATADAVGSIHTWEALRGKELRHFAGPEKVGVLSLSYAHGSNLLAAANADGIVRIWEPASGALKKQIALPYVTAARFSPDGSQLLCVVGQLPENADDLSHAIAFDGKTFEKLGTIETDLEYVVDATYSSDGKLIALSGGEALTDVAANKGGRTRNRLELHQATEIAPPTSQPAKQHTTRMIGETPQPLLSPVLSPGAKLVAAACGDWLVFECIGGKQIATLRAPEFKARCCAFSPNVRFVATGAIDSTVALFETRTWELRYQSQADPSMDVSAMAFNPDGTTLAVARGSLVDLIKVP
jgi:WD40 repeat protein